MDERDAVPEGSDGADVVPLPPRAESTEPLEDDEDFDGGSRGWVLRTVAVVAIIGLVALFVARPAQRPAGPPDFDLPLLDGTGSLSSASLRGRPVVLNFWASWCGPCREEAPLLERTWRRYRDRGVVFVGINVQDRPDDARRFVDSEGLTFPIVTDYDRSVSRELQVHGLPQTFFVNDAWRFHGDYAGGPEGRATPSGLFGAPRGVAVLGAITEEHLERQLLEMLGEDEGLAP